MRAEDPIVVTCPDDELLAGFVEDQLSDVERARVESHLAAARRDTTVRQTTRPRHHGIATPKESGFACPCKRFRKDPLRAGDDQRNDPPALGRIDASDDPVAAQLDHFTILAS